MSYNLDIIQVPIPADDLEAWHVLDTELRVSSRNSAKPLPDSVHELYSRLTAKYPCIMENEAGPWSDGPLINNFGHSLTILGLSSSRVEEVLPFLVSTANSLGFVVFDGQDERFQRPGKGPGRTLSELQADREAPAPPRQWWRFW